MEVTKRPIKSTAAPDDTRPWYDLSVDDGVLTVDKDGDGGSPTDLTGDAVDIDTSQNSIVAVDTNGELVSAPASSNGPMPDVYRAHLAWYDADADVVTVLEFAES